MQLSHSNRWALIIVACLMILTCGLVLSKAAATPGGDHKEVICHPVGGKGSTGLGYSVVDVDKASSHFDKDGNPKHEAEGRVDVYSDSEGHCPGYVEPEPSVSPTPSVTPTPVDDPTPTVDPTPTDEPTPTDQPTPTDEPTPTGEPTPSDVPTSQPPVTDVPAPSTTPSPHDPVILTEETPGKHKWHITEHHKSGKITHRTIKTSDIPIEEGF